MLHIIDEERILSNCEGKDVFVIHCGKKPMAEARDLLIKIKGQYPNIKIGLDTNAIHPSIQDIVDFYIDKPASFDEVSSIFRDSTKII
jgi:hypothetical protein